jgi:predicted enzyme related to lactoylglutathione lyase
VDLRVCVDVSDLEKAIAFYRDAFGLRPGRRLGERWAEMIGAPVSIDLLAEDPGTSPVPRSNLVRDYRRHWTPVHLDWPVPDLDAAVRRAVAAGATVDREPQDKPYGRLAVLADPFGNGFCFLEMRGRGYDELLTHPLGTRRPG